MGIKSQRGFQNRTLKEIMEDKYTETIVEEFTSEEIQAVKNEIDTLSQIEMAKLWRFAPVGHKYFDTTKPWHLHFDERFKKLGGMTPQISKEIGLR